MEQFLLMAQIQSILFLYMLIGYLCRKTELVPAEARQGFNNFLLYVSLPCMVFQSFDMELTGDSLRRGAVALLIASGTALAALVFGRFAYNHCAPGEKTILQYGTLVSNSGFAGLPIVQDAFGQEGLFLGSLFIIPTRILMWSAGISLFTDAPLKQRIKNVLLNPGIIAVELGLLRVVFQPAVPAQLSKALTTLGSMAAPLGLAMVGMILAEIDPRSVWEPKAFILVAMRQFLFPLGLLAVLRLLGIDPMTTSVAVVLTGMPIGCTTALLADKYGADAAFASKCVFVSTLTSLVTIPILTLFL